MCVSVSTPGLTTNQQHVKLNYCIHSDFNGKANTAALEALEHHWYVNQAVVYIGKGTTEQICECIFVHRMKAPACVQAWICLCGHDCKLMFFCVQEVYKRKKKEFNLVDVLKVAATLINCACSTSVDCKRMWLMIRGRYFNRGMDEKILLSYLKNCE